MQGEGAHTESGQFYGVQQGHLGHPIGFCTSTGPVLVTLNLGQKQMERQSVQIQYDCHMRLNSVTKLNDHVNERDIQMMFHCHRNTHARTDTHTRCSGLKHQAVQTETAGELLSISYLRNKNEQ